LALAKAWSAPLAAARPSRPAKIDIAVMQSLPRQGAVNALVANYGQIVVDACQHVGAASVDAILKRTKASTAEKCWC
jgi:superfamily II DNA or RNA helicase